MAVRTIDIKGHNKVRKEGIATVAIKPGYLINRSTAIGLRPHPVAAAPAMAFFALENEVIGGDVDGTYAIDDTVLAGVFSPGSEILAVLAASAVAIVVGDALEGAGDGTLRLVTVGDEPDYDITWTANEPTAGDTNTIDDGATVGDDNEAGQAIADITAKLNTLLPGAGHNIVAYALEAVDNSGGGGQVFIKIEVA